MSNASLWEIPDLAGSTHMFLNILDVRTQEFCTTAALLCTTALGNAQLRRQIEIGTKIGLNNLGKSNQAYLYVGSDARQRHTAPTFVTQ